MEPVHRRRRAKRLLKEALSILEIPQAAAEINQLVSAMHSDAPENVSLQAPLVLLSDE